MITAQDMRDATGWDWADLRHEVQTWRSGLLVRIMHRPQAIRVTDNRGTTVEFRDAFFARAQIGEYAWRTESCESLEQCVEQLLEHESQKGVLASASVDGTRAAWAELRGKLGVWLAERDAS